MRFVKHCTLALMATAAVLTSTQANAAASPKMKAEAVAGVEAQKKDIQVMVDTVFSYAEPGFQEFRTMEYLTGILEKNGFKVTKGVAGIPTAFTATWGEGGPVLALGSDIDNLLGTSQTPACRIRNRWSKARRGMAKAITRACRWSWPPRLRPNR
jgi:aminobenzoyl-glutamate utilization protein B